MNKLSTVGMSREEWLSIRRKTIGGSDAAGIIGLSQWSTPYTVWADKTGRLPDKEDSEAMRQGRDLEQYVAERWMEATGKKVRRVNAILYHEAYPFAHADIERAVVGENAILECKTTSTLDLKVFKSGEFPERYYTQCVHYLAVTGAQRIYLAVLVFGKGFYHYVLERDADEIKALMDAERNFFESYVKTDTPPGLDGQEPTTDALTTVYADGGTGGEVELFGRETLLDRREELKKTAAEINLQIAEIENTIKADMQDAERGYCGRYDVRWARRNGRKTFSVQSLAHDYPDIDISQYYEVGNPSRAFSVKVIKNKEGN